MRTKVLITFFFVLASSISLADRSQSHFKELINLEALAKLAKKNNLPIMLMFGAQWCEYCQILEDEVLNPMALSGDYEGKFMYMRHVGVDERDPIRGIDGSPLVKHKWAYRLDADITPTVIFIDSKGKEIAKRIVGVATYELFPQLIHRALNQAYKNLNNPLLLPLK